MENHAFIFTYIVLITITPDTYLSTCYQSLYAYYITLSYRKNTM